MTSEPNLSPFSEIIQDFKAGKMVILVDDARRENEGDLVIATECLTPEAMSFMTRYGRGLICVSISGAVSEKLNLPLQAINNNSPFNTPFAVSIDHRSVVGRGVTASGRTETMKRLIADDAFPDEFVAPGHVFPLIANPSGVIGRQGQTEGSFDLARIAGFKPSGVICEILGDDGTMSRGEALNLFAKTHGIKMTSVEEISRYRIHHEVLVHNVAHAVLETDYGIFRTSVYDDDVDGKEHLALAYGDLNAASTGKGVLVRIHSECLTGDVFGSRRCDCGAQLSASMKMITDEGAGVILYLRQEGRGIGLANKVKAYSLQDEGSDTVEANVKLGFEPDRRDFAVAANILSSLGVRSIRLITNNPRKIETIKRFGIELKERIPVIVESDEFSRSYLQTKRDKLGHLL